MIQKENVIVIDLDGTLCEIKRRDQDYFDVAPKEKIVAKLKEYRQKGFYIIIQTARNMRTFEGNLGRINAVTLKTIFAWLDQHDIPYDEVLPGRPWGGSNGFYVDDRTIRPDEFINLSLEEIEKITQ